MGREDDNSASGSDGAGRPRSHTEEEVISAVQAAIEEHEAPAVTKRYVDPYLEDYGEDRTAGVLADLAEENRLGQLSERGYTYWVPDKELAAGEVNPAEIRNRRPDTIDPADLERDEYEEIQEHFEDETGFAEIAHTTGVNLVHTGYVFMAAFIGGSLAQEGSIPFPVEIPRSALELLISLTVMFIFFGGIGIALGKVTKLVRETTWISAI